MELNHQKLVEFSAIGKDRLAELIIELVREDHDIRRASLDIVFSSPNVVTWI